MNFGSKKSIFGVILFFLANLGIGHPTHSYLRKISPLFFFCFFWGVGGPLLELMKKKKQYFNQFYFESSSRICNATLSWAQAHTMLLPSYHSKYCFCPACWICIDGYNPPPPVPLRIWLHHQTKWCQKRPWLSSADEWVWHPRNYGTTIHHHHQTM